MDLEVLHLLCHEQESSLRPLQRNRRSQGEKPVLHAGKQKEGKLSLSYMAHRTFSSGKHREAYGTFRLDMNERMQIEEEEAIA
jgi:hypothetical protein